MKRKSRILASAAALSTAAITGSVGCLMSGMQVEGNLFLVAAVAAITSLAGTFCFRRRLSYAPGIFLAALGLVLWVLGPLNRSVEYLVWNISCQYDMGYGWGILRWTQEGMSGESSTLALCYLASWLALAVTRSVVKPGGNLLGMLAVLLPMLPCLVLTDTVPATGFVFVTLLCFALLLLTQTVRGQDPVQAARLMGMLTLPVAVALGLFLLLCPRDTYTGQVGAEKLEELVASWFNVELPEEPVFKQPTKLSVAADVSATEVELTQVGPQEPGTQVVMRVRAEKSGTVYLRGSAYDYYDGTKWSVSQGDWGRDGEFAAASGKGQTLTISTTTPHKVRYLTYAPAETPALQNGRLENPDGITEYTVSYVSAAGFEKSWNEQRQSLPAEMQMYLTLPGNTKTEALEYLRTSVGLPKENMTAGDIYRYATTVGALVRNSASYDLNTQEMPEDAEDFALWFLRESDTGYCVHYASATAVLLRAAGIPARYVSGYLVRTQGGTTVDVRHKNAHAWVEYYIPGIGWMMLEPTASGPDSPVVVTQPEETEPTEETTTPEETTSPIEATEATTEPEEETTPTPTGDTPTGPTKDTDPAPTEELHTTQPQEISGQVREFNGKWMVTLALVMAVGAAVLAQWRVRVALRRKNRRRGKPNTQALYRWREVALCARLLGVKPDSQLHALAQKAKFSREIITPQELRQFEESLQESRKQLKKKPIWNQLVYTLILALY